MIDAVLWDNDGVLVDSETVFFEVTRAAFAALGLELSRELWMKSYLGAGRSSREIALELGGDPGRVERMLEERNETHRRRLAAGVDVRPGVARTLAALEGKVEMAMVTSSPRYQIDLIHQSTDLLRYFACIVTSDECPRLKPAPDAYLLAAANLEIAPARCLAVEDSYRGFSAARAAGIRCVLVPHELTDVAACAGAYRVEPDVRSLVSLVTGTGGR